jgi:hypothetical protein
MALSTICPNCNVENKPSNVVCEVCKMSLGAFLVGGTRDGAKWFAISLGLSLAFFVPCWGLELHPFTLLMSMFYGPLVASYAARRNVVWASSLGGTAAAIVIIVGALILHWSKMKLGFAALVGDTINDRGHEPGMFKVILGIVVVLLGILPLNMIGASVGEHLSVRRRTRKPTA